MKKSTIQPYVLSEIDEDQCLAQRPTKIDVSLKTDVSFKIDKPGVSLETIIFELR